ncbi:MAG TPA: DUF4831 family protein [Prolixibacteraceae bacterium]|nr:DUF4831 family protein [Prolixibacteraceae bacterium]HPR59642.1 DUF4831 family protein [Prolixibacteraceae bacterium]
MRELKPLLLLIAFLMMQNFGFAQRKSSEPVIEQVKVPDGFVYALPRNGIIVNVDVVVETYIPGPYAQYANKYLGIEKPVLKYESKCQIAGVNVDLFTEPDPNAVFKILDTAMVNISLLPNGIISGINSQQTIPHDYNVVGSALIGNEPISSVQFTDVLSDDFYEIIIDAENGTETMVAKSEEEKARQAADYLIRLRKKRAYTILSASDVVPEDGLGYKVFLEEAQRIEEEYVSLFAGEKSTKTYSYSFIYMPGEQNVKNEVLFRFSDSEGILPKTDLSGRPVYLAIEKEQNAVSAFDKLKQPANAEGSVSGLFYRMPAGVLLSITDGLKSIYNGRTQIAQMGVIVPFPNNTKLCNSTIQYNTTSGNIAQIEQIK